MGGERLDRPYPVRPAAVAAMQQDQRRTRAPYAPDDMAVGEGGAPRLAAGAERRQCRAGRQFIEVEGVARHSQPNPRAASHRK